MGMDRDAGIPRYGAPHGVAARWSAVLAGVALTVAGFCAAAGPALGAEEWVRQSIRARGMGNAFTAVANDEYALFYNPAGLQSVRVHMFEIIGLEGTVNQTLVDLVDSALSSPSGADLVDTFSEVAGERYYSEAELSGLSITGPGWGYSLFLNSVVDIAIQNPTVPFFDIRTYAQGGAVAGLAFSLFDYTVDIGVAAKYVYRAGTDQTYHFVDFAPLLNGEYDQLTDDAEATSAFAPDVGVIYHYDRFHQFPLKLAVSAQNIGGLDFGAAGKVPMTIHFGAATEMEVVGLDVILAADMLDVTGAQEREKSFAQDFKLGAEVGLLRLFNGHHLVSFRIGRNGIYNSYGFSVNVFGAKLDYANWSEEAGDSAGAEEDKRQAIRLSLVF